MKKEKGKMKNVKMTQRQTQSKITICRLPFLFFTFSFLIFFACTNPMMERLFPSDRGTNTRTVNFNSNGGSSVPSQNLAEGETASRPDNPTKVDDDGIIWGFVNWYDNEECEEPPYDFDTPVSANLTLYAKWSTTFLTVSFYSNGGSDVADQLVGEGGTASKPTQDPTKEGYNFGGWYRDSNLTIDYDFNTPVNSDIDLYAKWEIKRYTVTFEPNNGTPTVQEIVDHGGKVPEPSATMTRAGHSFGNWYIDEDCTEPPYDFDTPVTDDLKLYAKWTPNEAVISITVEQITDLSFNDIDGGTISRGGYGYPTSISFEYTDTGTCEWSIDRVGIYAVDGPLTATGSTFTVYAENEEYNSPGRHAVYLLLTIDGVPYNKTIWVTIVWTDIFYTVNFDSNGGSDVSDQTIAEGGRASELEPTRNGYEFVGWFSDPALNDWYDFNEPVTTDIDLYAKWLQIFTVTFNPDGGTPAPEPQYITDGGTVNRPDNPTKTGSGFMDWYDNVSLAEPPYDFDTTVTSNKILYAKWNNITLTVSFNSNGGTNVPIQTIGQGGKATRPANPTKSENTFVNWYSNETLSTVYNFNNSVTENITLYAKWNTIDDDDFGSGAAVSNIFNVANTTEWNTAVSAISGGGNNKNYIINVIADFTVAGRQSANFGAASNIKVSLRGAGRTVRLSSTYNLIRTQTNQTVILRDLTLQGYSSANNNSLVYVNGANSAFVMRSGKITGGTAYGGTGIGAYVGNGATFTMNGGEISNNSTGTGSCGGVFVTGANSALVMNGGKISGNSGPSSSANGNGGGVYILGSATFTMNGGEISGNTVSGTAYGGGVYMANSGTTFIMNGGEISGNKAYNGGGVYIADGTFTMYGGTISGNSASGSGTGAGGGGVHVSNSNTAIFRIVTGTIYGTNASPATLRNTGSSAAVFKGTNGISQRGTFSGTTWNSSGNVTSTNNTVNVRNGVLQ